MSIVEFNGPPSCSLNASETGESTKCPWVGVVEGTVGRKIRETVRDSLCLLFKGRGRNFGTTANQISYQSPRLRKNLSNQGNKVLIMCFLSE